MFSSGAARMLRRGDVAIKRDNAARRLFLFRCFYGSGCNGEDFGARRPVGYIFTNFFPEDGSVREHDENRWDRDVSTFHCYAPLQCHTQVRVFEQRIW
jgi:hypothetical protein